MLPRQIIHQNPPSYTDVKHVQCTNYSIEGCAEKASKVCDSTSGCMSFSVLLRAGYVGAELGPLALQQGQPNKDWSSWQKPHATPGTWTPQ